MNEFKKSLNAILYERTTSPFWGTLIISWMIWNWKIIYLTLFISEDKISSDKISYIKSNFCLAENLVWYPLISTIILLTIVPFISNGAYWLNLQFLQWRREKKNLIERKQLLTLEQSIEIREQLAQSEERFEKILNDKNTQIKQLEEALKNKTPNLDKKAKENRSKDENIKTEEIEILVNSIKSDPNKMKYYTRMLNAMQGGYRVDIDSVPGPFLVNLEANDVIVQKGAGVYNWGENGKLFNRLMGN